MHGTWMDFIIEWKIALNSRNFCLNVRKQSRWVLSFKKPTHKFTLNGWFDTKMKLKKKNPLNGKDLFAIIIIFNLI